MNEKQSIPTATPPVVKYKVVKTTIKVPDEYKYQIDPKNDIWGLRACFYDLLARYIGLDFVAEILEMDEWHIVLKASSSYFSSTGERITKSETLRLNLLDILNEMRLRWQPEKWITTQDGRRKKMVDEEKLKQYQANGYCLPKIKYDEEGRLVGVDIKLPPEAEREIWVNFLTVKKNALKTLHTVARRRLVMAITGIKTIQESTSELSITTLVPEYITEEEPQIQLPPPPPTTEEEKIEAMIEQKTEGTEQTIQTPQDKTQKTEQTGRENELPGIRRKA